MCVYSNTLGPQQTLPIKRAYVDDMKWQCNGGGKGRFQVIILRDENVILRHVILMFEKS